MAGTRVLLGYDEIKKIDPSKIICLDTEGAIDELAIIDGNETVLFDKRSEDQIINVDACCEVQKILYGAYCIIGYNLNADLRKLSDLGFKIANGALCLDVIPGTLRSLSIMYNATFESKPGGYSLKAIAEYVEIKTPQEGTWHESRFDAIVTLRLFKLFMEKGFPYGFCITPSIEVNPQVCLPRKQESEVKDPSQNVGNPKKTDEVNDNVSKEVNHMEKEWKNTELKDYGNGFYEALLYQDNEEETILVRLSKFEFSSLYTIREINPDYSLSSFYFDIILPGRKEKILKDLQEAKTNASLAVTTTVTTAEANEAKTEPPGEGTCTE